MCKELRHAVLGTEIPVVMCKLRGASRSFPEVRSGFLEKLSWHVCLPGLPSVP